MRYRSLATLVLFAATCSCGGPDGASQSGSGEKTSGTEGQWTVSEGRSVVTLEDGKGNPGQSGSNAEADVHFGNLVVNGGHVSATVKKSLIRDRFRFEPCYLDSEVGKRGKRIVLSVDMFVHADGRISDPKVTGADGAAAPESIIECVVDTLNENTTMPNGGERSRVLFRLLVQPPSATGSDVTGDLEEPF